ncbi:hypothetical protein KXV92_008093 [Aspergillus fumigatus]
MPPASGDRPANPDILIVEAWGQGFMVVSLILMIAITVANIKSGVVLHKMIQLVRCSPRFGIMLLSMAVSIAFTIVDTCAVLGAYPLGFPTGVEPFWK